MSKPKKHKCDICDKKDGFRDLFLQKCKTCGVCVHEQCYGLAPILEKQPNFECWACKAAGKTLTCRVKPNVTADILQRERPTECCLCSAEIGKNHAMHPIYDKHGKGGIQASLPANESNNLPLRPAWAHSVCCFILTNKINGGIYGCDSKGNYYDVDEDQSQSSDSDAQSETSWDKKSNLVSTSRFVIAGKEKGEHTRASLAVEEHRKELKCSICGKKDGGKGILRIPVQCSAGNEDEFDEYKIRHKEVNQPCFVALHVGCAKWGASGGQRPRFRRVWFYPGHVEEDEDDGYNNTVAEIYCDAHAADIPLNKPSQAKAAAQKKSGSVVSNVASKQPSVTESAAQSIPRKNPAVPARARTNLAHQRRLIKQQAKKKPKKTFIRDIHLSSTAAARQTSTKRALAASADNTEPVNSQTLSPEQQRGLLASGNAIPKLMRKKRSRTEMPSGKIDPNENSGLQAEGDKDWIFEVRTDISGIIKAGRQAGKSDEEIKPDVANRRIFWKKTTGLPKQDFKQLWAKVKNHINETMNTTDASDSTRRTSDSVKHNKPSQSDHSNADKLQSQSKNSMTVEQMHSIKSPWQFLWVGDQDYSTFDIGDWDTYKITKTA